MSPNLRFRSKTGVAALAGAALLAGSMGWGRAAMAAGQNETPVKGGTLVYGLETLSIINSRSL